MGIYETILECGCLCQYTTYEINLNYIPLFTLKYCASHSVENESDIVIKSRIRTTKIPVKYTPPSNPHDPPPNVLYVYDDNSIRVEETQRLLLQ